MVDSNTYGYWRSDLFEEPLSWEISANLSKFDVFLEQRWKDAMDNGMFRYNLQECKYRTLKGKEELENWHGCAQLNLQRGTNRRTPFVFETMNAKFSNEQFNFTKVKDGEVLFYLNPRSPITTTASDNDVIDLTTDETAHAVIINVSPIDRCHVLLVPDLEKHLPQHITADSLLVAFDLIQLSSHPGFRVGFNSIHAWASVNHLHFHAMYGEHELYIDNLPHGPNIATNCHLLDERSPLHGFVFAVHSHLGHRQATAERMSEVINFFHHIEMPYTVLITRSTRGYKTRAFLWPRKSTKNLAVNDDFNVACVEAGGHYPVRSEESYESLTLSKAFTLVHEASLSDSEFHIIQAKVSEILSS